MSYNYSFNYSDYYNYKNLASNKCCNLSSATNGITGPTGPKGDIGPTGPTGETSDERDKQHIVDLENSLDFLSNLRPVRFEWNMRDSTDTSKQGTPDIGFIAQNLLKLQEQYQYSVPNLVDETDPDRYRVNYFKLLPVFAKSIQEIHQKVLHLEEQNNLLHNKILQLELAHNASHGPVTSDDNQSLLDNTNNYPNIFYHLLNNSQQKYSNELFQSNNFETYTDDDADNDDVDNDDADNDDADDPNDHDILSFATKQQAKMDLFIDSILNNLKNNPPFTSANDYETDEYTYPPVNLSYIDDDDNTKQENDNTVKIISINPTDVSINGKDALPNNDTFYANIVNDDESTDDALDEVFNVKFSYK